MVSHGHMKAEVPGDCLVSIDLIIVLVTVEMSALMTKGPLPLRV